MPPTLNTWTDPDGITHGVDEYEVGYFGGAYDWVPWCKIKDWVTSTDIEKASKTPINCIACMKEMP